MQLYRESPLLRPNFGRLMAAQRYWDAGWQQRQAIFELTASSTVAMPDLADLLAFLQVHRFGAREVEYLANLGLSERFLNALQRMPTRIDLYAAASGTLLAPGRPLLRVQAAWIEAQVRSIPILHFLPALPEVQWHYECIAEQDEAGIWQPEHLNPAAIVNFGIPEPLQLVMQAGQGR